MWSRDGQDTFSDRRVSDIADALTQTDLQQVQQQTELILDLQKKCIQHHEMQHLMPLCTDNILTGE